MWKAVILPSRVAPMRMTDGRSPVYRDWRAGYDPDTWLDRAINATRTAVLDRDQMAVSEVVLRYGVMAAGRGGKAKTVLQAVAIGLYIFPLSGVLASARWWVMGAAFLLTVLTGLDYVYRALTLRQTSARAMKAAAARRAAGGQGVGAQRHAAAPGQVPVGVVGQVDHGGGVGAGFVLDPQLRAVDRTQRRGETGDPGPRRHAAEPAGEVARPGARASA